MAKQVENVPIHEKITAEAEKSLGQVNRTLDYLNKNPDLLDKAAAAAKARGSKGLGRRPMDG